MRKILFFLVVGIFGNLFYSNAQKAQIYNLEKLYSPVVGDGNFSVWREESILIPIRFDSKDLSEVSITYEGPNSQVELYKLHEVWADFSAGNCGETKTQGTFEKVKVPDRAELMTGNSFNLDSENQWVLLSLRINQEAPAGSQSYKITFTQKQKKSEVKGNLSIRDRSLKGISGLDFYTDFWQFPVAMADFYKTKPWSASHWKEVERMFDQLGAINQHSITAFVFWDLYNTRIRPLDEMLIQVKKSAQGEYRYDYSTFDKYIQTAKDRGISDQISIHNLFPWNGFLFYFDETKGEVVSIQTQPGTPEYQEFWEPLLVDLEKHLKEKDWLDQAVLFVDERDPNQTLALAQWVKSITPGFKMGFSGDFYPFLSPWMDDYSTPVNVVLDPAELSKRILSSQRTSIYTSCFEQPNQPNFLLTSDFRDIYFLTQLSNTRGYNGFLRWAFNLWSSEIENTAIYSDLPSGDAHLVYPNGQVSTRYLVLLDALEEIKKFKLLGKLSYPGDMVNATNRYFLINIEEERYQMVRALKNYLNE